MTTVNYFNCPYVIKKFDKHDELKNDVLDCINNQSSFKIKSDTTNIRSDWGSYKNTSKKYWSILEKDINLYLKNIFNLNCLKIIQIFMLLILHLEKKIS